MYRIATSSLYSRGSLRIILDLYVTLFCRLHLSQIIYVYDNVLSSFMPVRLNPWVKCLPHSIPVISSM